MSAHQLMCKSKSSTNQIINGRAASLTVPPSSDVWLSPRHLIINSQPCYAEASQEMSVQYPFMMAIKGNESWWPPLLQDDVRPHYYPPHLLLGQLRRRQCRRVSGRSRLFSPDVNESTGSHVRSFLNGRPIQSIWRVLKNKGLCVFFSNNRNSVPAFYACLRRLSSPLASSAWLSVCAHMTA